MEVEFNFHLVKPAKCKYKDRLWINTLKIKEPLARQIARSISLTSLSRDGVEKTGKAVALYGLAIMLYSRCWRNLWSFYSGLDSSGDKEAFVSSGQITVMHHRMFAFGSGTMTQHLQYINPTSCFFFFNKSMTKWCCSCYMNDRIVPTSCLVLF